MSRNTETYMINKTACTSRYRTTPNPDCLLHPEDVVQCTSRERTPCQKWRVSGRIKVKILSFSLLSVLLYVSLRVCTFSQFGEVCPCHTLPHPPLTPNSLRRLRRNQKKSQLKKGMGSGLIWSGRLMRIYTLWRLEANVRQRNHWSIWQSMTLTLRTAWCWPHLCY